MNRNRHVQAVQRYLANRNRVTLDHACLGVRRYLGADLGPVLVGRYITNLGWDKLEDVHPATFVRPHTLTIQAWIDSTPTPNAP